MGGPLFNHFCVVYRRIVGKLLVLHQCDVVDSEDCDIIAGRVLLSCAYRPGTTALRFSSAAQLVKSILEPMTFANPMAMVRMTLDRLNVQTTRKLHHIQSLDVVPSGFVLYPRVAAGALKPKEKPGGDSDPLAAAMQAGIDVLLAQHPHAAHAPPADGAYEVQVTDSSSESDAEQIEPEGPDDAASVCAVDVGDHVWLWLTRTNRAATCQACKGQIAKSEFRVVYHPFALEHEKHSAWKGVFWKYHHLRVACMTFVQLAPWYGQLVGGSGHGAGSSSSAAPPAVAAIDLDFRADVAPLPAAAAETVESRRASTEEAGALLRQEFKKAIDRRV